MNNLLTTKEEISTEITSSEETGGVVKWLYPQELEEYEMSSEGSDREIAVKADETAAALDESPAVTASADPVKEEKAAAAAAAAGSLKGSSSKNSSLNLEDEEEIDVTEEITKQVTAGANYVGTMFNSAWSKTQKAADSGIKASTSLFNFAAGYDLNKPSDDEDEPEEEKEKAEDKKDEEGETKKKVESPAKKPVFAVPKSASSFFGSALSKLDSLAAWTTEESSEQAAAGSEGAAAAAAADQTPAASKEEEEGNKKGGWTSSFGGLGADLSSIVKVATDATSVIKAKVQSTTLLSEFNREQEEFIKNKGEK